MTDVRSRQRRKVVIVGAQFAGQKAYQELAGDFDVLVVDCKEYFEFTPSILKCLVDPHLASRFIFPYEASTITAIAVDINFQQESGGILHLDDGQTLTFDYLLLCCGSSYASPIKNDASKQTTLTERLAAVKDAHTELEASQRVCVVGGGAVGVELAAEVAGKYGRSKHVTIVTSASRLLERMSPKAGAAATAWLQRHGVEVLLGERIIPELSQSGARIEGGASLTTSTGRVIQCDIMYRCTGVKSNAAVLATLLGNASGQAGDGVKPSIPVTSTLQVRGLPSFVFAAGDCTSTGEEKTALAADLSATLAALNIARMSKGKPLLHYPEDVCHGGPPPVVEVISLYRHNGVMQFNNLVISGWVTAVFKRLVEVFAVASAKGEWWARVLWGAMEVMLVWLGSCLFR